MCTVYTWLIRRVSTVTGTVDTQPIVEFFVVYVEVFICKRQYYYNAIAAEVNYEGIFYDNDYHGSPLPSRSKRFSDTEQL
jgi:hypothetical protein